ncbi:chemoreceptor glutamine deamidase CheD [Salinisphaera dokdonensis CL-ES53]|uniref:Probable chemoreceptor glutamine deamidase CheD n=1 Tax=Salinisphaera dokdonensis CL-ES53 TaxID=1304272 RepID=A0ABV2AYD2_9GAMM
MSRGFGHAPLQAGPMQTYFDQRHGMNAIRVLPNEYVATGEDVVLTTVLGSCVSACLRDPVAGVGGINHFMLPVAGPDVGELASRSLRYGINAMDRLIEALVAQGARPTRLEAKVFGGGQLMTGVAGARIGEANARFVVDYLQREGIVVHARDLGENCARQLHYFPATGRARVKRLSDIDPKLAQHDRLLADTLVELLPVGDIAGPVAVDISRRWREQAS